LFRFPVVFHLFLIISFFNTIPSLFFLCLFGNIVGLHDINLWRLIQRIRRHRLINAPMKSLNPTYRPSYPHRFNSITEPIRLGDAIRCLRVLQLFNVGIHCDTTGNISNTCYASQRFGDAIRVLTFSRLYKLQSQNRKSFHSFFEIR
jgi:hypothetical protein